MAKTICVTGAAGGVGHVLVEHLLARGDRVIATARRLDQIESLTTAGALGIAMDVAKDESVTDAFAQIMAVSDGRLDAVIHCAAVAPIGTVEFTTAEAVSMTFNINTLGTLRVLQASLPMLRKAPSGRLVLVSSLWGQLSGPFVSTYAASKHAIEALADAARREMRGQSVHLSVVEPGVIKTPMFSNQAEELARKIAGLSPAEASLYGGKYRDYAKLLASAEKTATTAQACVSAILRCLDDGKPKPRYRVGTDARMLIGLDRILTDRGLDRVFGMMFKSK